MTESQFTLGDLFKFTCDNLPQDWEFTFTMTKDEVYFDLIDPDGGKPEVCHDDCDTSETIEAYVNFARTAEGLPVAHVARNPPRKACRPPHHD